MRNILMLFLFAMIAWSCKSDKKETEVLVHENPVLEQQDTINSAEINVRPVSHATAVIEWEGSTIYIDPVGGAEAFSEMPEADFVLITDIHGDHMDATTLSGLQLGDSEVIVPKAVKEELPDSLALNYQVMNNGEQIEQNGFTITAIPMYNLRKEAKQYHPIGRGNGYLLEKDGKRLYIAGDTEDIPEMRELKNIDVALVPMNLPYTMPVDAAADAVIEFAPKVVYPYHFRGKDGKSDVEKFRSLVNEANKDIEVVLAEWYPSDSEQK